MIKEHKLEDMDVFDGGKGAWGKNRLGDTDKSELRVIDELDRVARESRVVDDKLLDLGELEDAGVVVHEIDVVESGFSKESKIKEIQIFIRERHEVDPRHIRVPKVSDALGSDTIISCKLEDSPDRHVTEH